MAIDGSSEIVLVEGNDFYSNPRLSPDGRKLAWLTWNHPHMPWMSTELWVGGLDQAGQIVSRRKIAGSQTESLFQPEWSPEGVLHFVSDRTGWWNLYRESSGQIEALFPKEAEFGQPLWNLGASTYAFAGGGRIVCSYREGGKTRLTVLDSAGGQRELDLSFTEVSSLRCANGEHPVARRRAERTCLHRPRNPRTTPVRSAAESFNRRRKPGASAACLSTPSLIEFPTASGKTAFLWCIIPRTILPSPPPPTSCPRWSSSRHGGPTAAASSTLDLEVQFWTSRGFAVADVDYGGSSGYGREYRERLHMQWGVVDVEDCTNAAKYLAEKNLADPARAAITGGSAGALYHALRLDFRRLLQNRRESLWRGRFGNARHRYHISSSRTIWTGWLANIRRSAKPTSIVRPFMPLDRLKVPVILFQGEEDKIVPPNQVRTYRRVDCERRGFRSATSSLRKNSTVSGSRKTSSAPSKPSSTSITAFWCAAVSVLAVADLEVPSASSIGRARWVIYEPDESSITALAIAKHC